MFVEKVISHYSNNKNREKITYILQCDTCNIKFERNHYTKSKYSFCSRKCYSESKSDINGVIYKQSIEISLAKYGVPHRLQAKEVKDKIIATNLERYGVTHPNKSKIVRDKTVATNLRKFGVVTNLLLPTVNRQKSKDFNTKMWKNIHATNIKKFGAPNIEMMKNIPFNHLTEWNKKYGVPHLMQLPEIKQKIKETMMKKYGFENSMALMLSRGFTYDESVKKAHATKKKNGTYKVSKEENNVYKLFCEKFGSSNVERQVSIKTWAIDFYIKNINTYVEYNGSYYHGLNRPIAIIKQFKTKHDKKLYLTFLKDQDKVKWFAENNKRLVVLLDKDTKADIFRKLAV